jgi:thymidylate synthase
MAGIDKMYHSLANSIIDYGYWYTDESRGIRCKQLSDVKLDIPLQKEFPLLTTKKMFTKGVVAELIWFLRGDNNIKFLVNNGVNIWNKDAYNWYLKNLVVDEDDVDNMTKDIVTFVDYIKEGVDWGEECKPDYTYGDIGRNYGVQWRKWSNFDWINGEPHWTEEVDQIKNLIDNIRKKPIGRRHIVTAWNPAEIAGTALPPCHWSFEILPRPLYLFEREQLFNNNEILEKSGYGDMDNDSRHKLFDKNSIQNYGFTLKWHQRSVDTFLGLPFNIASYGLLAHIIGQMTGMLPLNLVADLSNVHFYEPHIEIIKEQLKRNPEKYPGCQFKFNDETIRMFNKVNEKTNFDTLFQSLEVEDFIFENYNSYDKLNAEMFEPKVEN